MDYNNLIYLIAASMLIMGLKYLSSPKTARRGNLFAMLGMLIAVVVTLLDQQILDYTYIIAGLVIGGLIGAVGAKKVKMTAMPQMVAIFNGFGGLASTLVALAEYYLSQPELAPVDVKVTISLSILIGTITFVGSLIAFAKLQELMNSGAIVLPMHNGLNVLLLLGSIALAGMYIMEPTNASWLLILIGVSFILGIIFVIPIGGADMPVVISLLNSFSGLAAAMAGFVISNNMLIISGSLVGASGLILTNIMCVAMNRSLFSVLFKPLKASSGGKTGEGKNVVRYTAEDAATIMNGASSVIIVPGYGLAVAQAQHVLQEVGKALEDEGIQVRYAIHPVAGRMPGHMNVLLAEANVSYDSLYEMEAINNDFQNTDVSLVIGANDVVNPVAETDKDSPLWGMPILNVHHSRHVMIIKRSLSPGFAGVDNPLFYDDKTMMVFGDAKKVLTDLVQILKS
jgi:NAD(P) transhydrogenase subunit beta